ncbi:hypothetical protein ColKHC_07553 [Colletotrichum higginsianum]|nr:hypothetical protein ColKHC_07553 [Colletotrichum higginsianum]
MKIPKLQRAVCAAGKKATVRRLASDNGELPAYLGEEQYDLQAAIEFVESQGIDANAVSPDGYMAAFRFGFGALAVESVVAAAPKDRTSSEVVARANPSGLSSPVERANRRACIHQRGAPSRDKSRVR